MPTRTLIAVRVWLRASERISVNDFAIRLHQKRNRNRVLQAGHACKAVHRHDPRPSDLSADRNAMVGKSDCSQWPFGARMNRMISVACDHFRHKPKKPATGFSGAGSTEFLVVLICA
jgi:hypothetical protein